MFQIDIDLSGMVALNADTPHALGPFCAGRSWQTLLRFSVCSKLDEANHGVNTYATLESNLPNNDAQ